MARSVLLHLGSSHSIIPSQTSHNDASTVTFTSVRNSPVYSSVGLPGCNRRVRVCASARNYVENLTPVKTDKKLKLFQSQSSDKDENRSLKFSYLFCDMDGTLLNSKGIISPRTVEALKEATSRGINVVMATGKSRYAATKVLEAAGLTGTDGVFSDLSPGVFTQGLVVYGRNGKEIFRRNLDPSICKEACVFSLEHNVPLVAFCENRCLTLFDHPMVDYLHTFYHEPKVEIVGSVEQLLDTAEVQKLLFLDTDDGLAAFLRPYWSKATKGRADVVQAVPDMLEIVPPGSSKGVGVRILLEHLGASENEIMAIGDGENDVEMLELAGLGVALRHGSEKAKAVADVIGLSNDEDGAADAIYRYAF